MANQPYVVGWKHPYPTFYWEHSTGSVGWQDAVNLSGYVSGQGTDTFTLSGATPEETGFVRCALSNPAGDIVYTRQAVLSAEAVTLNFVAHPQNLELSASLFFVQHPEDQTITETATASEEYFHDFTTKLIVDWTHTRLSNATAPDETGVIQTYTTDQPAWYKDRGLQLEDERTNELLHSSDFSQSPWALSGDCSIASTSTLKGLYAAELYVQNGSGSIYQITTTGGLAAQDITITFIAQRVVPYLGDDDIRFGFRDFNGIGFVDSSNMTYEMLEGPGTFVESGTTLTIADLSASVPSVIRITIPNISITDTIRCYFYPGTSGAPADAERRVLIGAPQMEFAAAFPSSHIPTSGTAVTRGDTNCSAVFSDIWQLPDAGFTNDFCGQIVFTLQTDLSQTVNFGHFFNINHIANDERFYIRVLTPSNIQFSARTAGGSANEISTSIDPGDLPAGSVVDLRYKVSAAGGVTGWVNGVRAANTDPVPNFTSPIDEIRLGRNHSGTLSRSIVYEEARIHDGVLSDEEIEAW